MIDHKHEENASDPVLLEQHGDVAIVTINREARRNSLDHHTMARLEDVFGSMANDGTLVTIITGRGSKAFCAGDDVKAYKERTADESRAHFERGLRVFDMIERHPTFVIAAIEGCCIGGGLELALCADYRIAAANAYIALPEVRKMKAYPSWGGLTRLPKVVGRQTAKRIALVGEVFNGTSACDVALVDSTVEAGGTLPAALQLASELAADLDKSIFGASKRMLLQAEVSSGETLAMMNLFAERSQQFTGDA